MTLTNKTYLCIQSEYVKQQNSGRKLMRVLYCFKLGHLDLTLFTNKITSLKICNVNKEVQ